MNGNKSETSKGYRSGRHHHQRNCGAQPGGADTPPAICCAWVDEFEQPVFAWK